jgi:hypothetical protein
MTGIARWVIASVAAGSMAMVTGVASAASGPVSIGGVTGTWSVPDVVSFDGPGCATVPWTLNYQRPPGFEIDLDVSMVQEGSNSPETDFGYISSTGRPDAGAFTLTPCVEDYDFDAGRGPFTLTGSIQVDDDDYRDLGTAQIGPVAIRVERNPARFVRLKAKAGRTIADLPVVKGKVVARTLTKGSIGADGTITIEAKVKGRWRKADSSATLDEFGRFSTTLWNQVTEGMKIRVRLSDCGWCTNAKAATRAG